MILFDWEDLAKARKFAELEDLRQTMEWPRKSREPTVLRKALDRIRQMAPKMIFSAHLPPARGKDEQFLELLARVPTSTPFVAPKPDGTGADIGSDEGRELTKQEPAEYTACKPF